MFKVRKTTHTGLVRMGLSWTVDKRNYMGFTKPFAYCSSEREARLVAEAMNATATVDAVIVTDEQEA